MVFLLLKKSALFIKHKAIDLTFLIFMISIMTWGRWNSIKHPYPLNPDEAQFTASVLRIISCGYNWDKLDGGTSGPLNSLILSWPHLLGLDSTFNTTRLTALMLLSITAIFLYYSIKLVSKNYWAMLWTLPLVAFYAFAKTADFLHYSSELLPVSLLVCANFFILKAYVTKSTNAILYLFSGVALGMAPFAKLQSSPMVLIIGVFAFVVAYLSDKRKQSIKLLLAGGIVPASFFLLPLAYSDHLNDFWQSYLVSSSSYVKPTVSLRTILYMIQFDRTLMYVIVFSASLGGLSMLLSSWRYAHDKTRYRLSPYLIIYLLILQCVTLYSIAKPGRAFSHYLMFYPQFLLLFLGFITTLLLKKNNDIKVFCSCYLGLGVFFLCLSAYRAPNIHELKFKLPKPTIPLEFSTRNPNLLSWLPFTPKSLLVWAWMPQWYVWTNIPPATRTPAMPHCYPYESIDDFHRNSFILDFKQSNPDVIIDGVCGDSFFYDRNTRYISAPKNFPEFGSILYTNYNRLLPLVEDDDCPKVYVKNTFKELIDRVLIMPASVSVSPSTSAAPHAYTLFDNFVMEDETVVDYCLLPEKTLGHFEIKLSQPEEISKLMILNTRNGNLLNYSTKAIRVCFYMGKELASAKDAELKPYPYWTTIDFDKTINATSFMIEIRSFLGNGAGINEVKIFRPITRQGY